MSDIHSSVWRRNVNSGSIYEERVGYSRAVRVGDHVFMAGTTAIEDGRVVGVGEPDVQVRTILGIIERALAEVGATWQHVLRYRVYLVDIAHWETDAEVLAETVGGVRLVNTLVEISGLVDPQMLVEIDLDAVLSPAA